MTLRLLQLVKTVWPQSINITDGLTAGQNWYSMEDNMRVVIFLKTVYSVDFHCVFALFFVLFSCPVCIHNLTNFGTLVLQFFNPILSPSVSNKVATTLDCLWKYVYWQIHVYHCCNSQTKVDLLNDYRFDLSSCNCE